MYTLITVNLETYYGRQGVARHGMARYGRQGVAWRGLARRGQARYGRQGAARQGKAGQGEAGMARHGEISDTCNKGKVQCSQMREFILTFI